MSRSIDLTKRLSAEDREYLDSRGRNDLIEQNDRQFGKASEPTRIDDGNTGDIDPFKADDGTDAVTGTHPAETTASAIARIEAQGISDLDDEDKDPDGLVTTALDPSKQAGDGEKDQPEPESDVETSDNYDDKDVWSYEDLKEEVSGRENIDIALNSSRADLIAALRADDAADSDEEETGGS